MLVVFSVVGVLNERFRQALGVCKELNGSGCGLANDPRTSSITADKLIYNYAIEMVSSKFLYTYTVVHQIINFRVIYSTQFSFFCCCACKRKETCVELALSLSSSHSLHHSVRVQRWMSSLASLRSALDATRRPRSCCTP